MNEKESLNIKEKLMLTSFQNKNYEKAKDVALSMTEQFPNYNLSWKILSSICLLKGEVNNALTLSKKAITVDPKDAVYIDLDRAWDEAIKASNRSARDYSLSPQTKKRMDKFREMYDF